LKKLIIIFLFLSNSWLIAQKANKTINDSVLSTAFNKNQIKLSPLRLIGIDRGIDLSYERQFSSGFSVQITGRYIVDIFENTSLSTYNNLNGYAFYIDPKYYFNTTQQSRTFVSINLGHINCQYKIVDDFINPNADTINKMEFDFRDTVAVSRKVFDFTINCGVQKYYKKFLFEFSAGLGLRYREITIEEKLFTDQHMFKNRHQIFGGPNEEGHFFSPLIPLRFKVGYRF